MTVLSPCITVEGGIYLRILSDGQFAHLTLKFSARRQLQLQLLYFVSHCHAFTPSRTRYLPPMRDMVHFIMQKSQNYPKRSAECHTSQDHWIDKSPFWHMWGNHLLLNGAPQRQSSKSQGTERFYDLLLSDSIQPVPIMGILDAILEPIGGFHSYQLYSEVSLRNEHRNPPFISLPYLSPKLFQLLSLFPHEIFSPHGYLPSISDSHIERSIGW